MAEEVEMCVEIASKIDNTWIEKADINLLCRACATETNENMIPIFEGTGLELDLQAKIDKHLPVKITKDDGLPNKMCVQCASTLVAWHDIYTGCTDAETKLKNLLNKSKDNAHTGDKVAGSSVENEDPVTQKPESQQKVAGEMEVDDNDSDYIYEGDEDDDDYVQDDDDDIDEDGDEEQETEEVVIEKLDSKEKGKTVEITDKGTIIRDQIVVVKNDNNQKQLISFALNMNINDKTLELSSSLPANSIVEEYESVIIEVVKSIIDNYGLDDDTLTIKYICTSEKPDGNEIDSDTGFNETKRQLEINNYELSGDDDTLANEFNSNSEKPNGIKIDTDLNATKIDKEAKKMALAANGQSYYCKECNLRYRLRHNFEAHMNEHKSADATSKVDGGKSSSDLPLRKSIHNEPVDENTSNLKIPRERPVKRLCCKLCNKQLTTTSGLLYHMRHVHGGLKQHACDICGRCFSSKGPLKEHRRIHTGEKPYTCHLCGKSHRTQGILAMHLKYHSNVRPYVCPICKKSYIYSGELKRHSVIHTGEKNFVCDTCGKRFTYNRDMKRHMLTHNEVKYYQCHICSSIFNQRRYLRDHLLKKHHLDKSALSSIMRNVKVKSEPGPVVANSSENECESETTVHQTEEVRVNETEPALQVMEKCGKLIAIE